MLTCRQYRVLDSDDERVQMEATSSSRVLVSVSRAIFGPRSTVWHPLRSWSLPGSNAISGQHEGLFALRQTVVSPEGRAEAARRRPRLRGRRCAGAVTPVARLASRNETATQLSEDSRIPSDERSRAAQLEHGAPPVRTRAAAQAQAGAGSRLTHALNCTSHHLSRADTRTTGDTRVAAGRTSRLVRRTPDHTENYRYPTLSVRHDCKQEVNRKQTFYCILFL